jgi:hypothetical protein
MINKEEALHIALQVIPDLQNRGYKISDKISGGETTGKFPAGCWYIKYSSVPLSHSACGTGKTMYLCIDMETGEIRK